MAIDNDVFRLHYRYTVFLLVACSALLSASQFFGKPIDCHMRGEKLPGDMVNTYCWIHGTYTLKYINKPEVREMKDLSDKEKLFVQRFVFYKGEKWGIVNVSRYGYSKQLLGAAHPGFGAFHPNRQQKMMSTSLMMMMMTMTMMMKFHVDRHQKIYHMYYQWVFLFFCIQVKLILSQEPIFPKTF